ncbi:hypothetical protein P1P70_40215, partial [Streptomyces sp. MB09-02B]|nr:hypothetical protein [Streptomyces sp. MB09-02B]
MQDPRPQTSVETPASALALRVLTARRASVRTWVVGLGQDLGPGQDPRLRTPGPQASVNTRGRAQDPGPGQGPGPQTAYDPDPGPG